MFQAHLTGSTDLFLGVTAPSDDDYYNATSSSDNAIRDYHSVKILAYISPKQSDVEVAEWGNVRKLWLNEFGFETLRPDPSVVGFYDFMDVETRRRQASLAREHGVHGFVFPIYWFDGKPVMDESVLAMLEDGEPDIPFMFSWSNDALTLNGNVVHRQVRAECYFLMLN